MLDKSDIVDYIYSMMRNMEDEMLIERYISLARRNGWTLEHMGLLVGRSKQWASDLTRNRRQALRFSTRNRILNVLDGRGNHHATDTRRAEF